MKDTKKKRKGYDDKHRIFTEFLFRGNNKKKRTGRHMRMFIMSLKKQKEFIHLNICIHLYIN